MKISPELEIIEAEKVTEAVEDNENRNQKTVKMVYRALLRGEAEKLGKVVGKELEWWYHGPPHHQHMMKMLTGGGKGDQSSTQNDGFKFRPRRMKCVMGDRVIVEGWEEVGEYWVHVWRVKEGIITQLREYFNTLLTVVSEDGKEGRLWRSTPWARVQGSLPDLVLAI